MATSPIDRIIFENKSDAEEGLRRLKDIITQYNVATICDLYDLVNCAASEADCAWGWTNLDDSIINEEETGDGYYLSLPDPSYIFKVEALKDRNWGIDNSGLIYSDEELGIFDQVAYAHNQKIWEEATVKTNVEQFFNQLEIDDIQARPDCSPKLRKILINARYAQKIKMEKALALLSTFDEKMAFINDVKENFSAYLRTYLRISASDLKLMDVSSMYPSEVKHSLKGLKVDPPNLFDYGTKTQIDPEGSPVSPGNPIHFNSIAEVMETTGLKEETIRDLWDSGYFYRAVKFTTNGWHRDPVRP